MELYINGSKTTAALLEDVNTVEEILEALREKGLVGESEVILDVEVDGKSSAEQAACAVGKIRLDGAEKVCVQTGTPCDYAARVLDDAEEVSEFLQSASRRVAQSFRTGRSAESNDMLYRLLDSIHTLLHVLRCAERSCGLDESCFGENGGEVLDKVQNTLQKIKSAQSAEEWQKQASHLDEELVEMLGTARKAIKATRQKATAEE